MVERKPIFSGPGSEELWRGINGIANKRRRRKIARAVSNTLYLLGCRLQELESRLERIEAKDQK